jgi:hypothetical protein
MSIAPVGGMPGIRTGRQADHRIIFKGGMYQWLPGGKIIDGTKTRDSGNTGATDRLRAGLMMGKVSASGKYANSIIGVTTGAFTSGGTSITVSAAQAAEIVRRVGLTGNLQYVGPPAASGTVAVIASKAYSAINTGTGVITTADLGANLIAGGFVIATDGSGVPITLIGDGFPIKVTDPAGASQDTFFEKVPCEGILISSNIINWPTDTSLQAWIVASMNAASKFEFDHLF